ncbi:shikimate kinase [Methanospirillum sp.]|uniref:shikimate kinase n=1 Tax=Methanospirillum sp. TaxID=45200 RepID=UPI0029877BAC|nr:shikimate kinase [Methanospirillum sp.]
MNNIVLIGLPGSGKSTLGVILAKTLGFRFIDTDIVIQEHTGKLLQDIIDNSGVNDFLKVEEACILSLECIHTVIATGGSVVYSIRAMQHLKSDGITIYLEISFDEMVKRLKNIITRGVVLEPGQNLRDMYDQRIPLYEKYADIRVDCSDEAFEIVVEKVIMKIRENNGLLCDMKQDQST